ncbi:MAG: metal-dependent transcriptional regulator [Rhodococcus sp.]|nr:metal-dependent transcriptional regulator [Rhodococcus sp. (in: high G+C Gram-positive bacteria)]
MRDLINTNETYLRTIYNLEEDGLQPRQTRLVERLGQASTTVSQTVARMKRNGLIAVDDGHRLWLTESGRAIAVRVTRKHRLAECMLLDIVGIGLLRVHDEADRLEHVIGDAVERRIVDLLGAPAVSPWGNPIPGLDELGCRASAFTELSPGPNLTEIDTRGGVVSETVAYVSEHAQELPEIAQALAQAGVLAGADVSVESAALEGGSGWVVYGEHAAVSVPVGMGHIVRFASE